MCGIALVADGQAGGASLLDTLARMHQDVATRGPDGEGWLVVDSALEAWRYDQPPLASALPRQPVTLAGAFRRLAIRDTRPEAGQPLSGRNAAHWIFHNGEIYNDAELRRDLESRGARFTTGSDAETIIAAYDAWGDACFERLRGMWAVVIVDLARGQLVVSRDRLGIKPLFFATEGLRTIVASHARTVAQALATGPEIDRARWHRFLRGMPAETADGGFFARVRAVPAGSILTIGLKSSGVQEPQRRRYWSLDGCLPDPGDRRTDEAAEEELLHLLEASTRDHLIADRQVGCLLSGGLDSSVVACLAAQEGRRRGGILTCFSIVFDDPRMSEWPYIQSVAAHAGVRSITHRLTPEEVFELVDQVVAAQGEPLLGQDTIAHYRVFGLAKEHDCVVALEGQAADELFAGLPSYEAVMFREWLAGGAWRRVLHEVRLRARAQGRSQRSVFREYTLGPVVRSWTTRRRRHAWLDPEQVSPAEPRDRSADPSLLNRHLFELVRHTNLPAVLLIQDRNAMAHGVENRPVFLDHRIVEWAFRLPSSSKVSQGRRKRVLWNTARHIVPPLVLARTDKRAIVSRGDWMPLRIAHREAVAAMADSRTLREAPFIRAREMRTFVHDYLRGAHDDGMSVWRLYTAWRWLERFRPAV